MHQHPRRPSSASICDGTRAIQAGRTRCRPRLPAPSQANPREMWPEPMPAAGQAASQRSQGWAAIIQAAGGKQDLGWKQPGVGHSSREPSFHTSWYCLANNPSWRGFKTLPGKPFWTSL